MSGSIFGLTPNSVLVAPFPVQAGNDVAVTIRLFNTERAAAKKVKVEAWVDGDKLGETTVDLPIARAVIASGFPVWKAKPGRHEVRAVVTAGDRSGNASKPVDVRPPDGMGRGGIAMLVGRGAFSLSSLQMTAADVRLNPLAPAVGAAVDVSVRIQNTASSDANGVRVELFADGTRLGEVSGNVAAGKDYVFGGFPKWTAAAGAHKLLLRANAAGRIVEATRDVTVGGAAIMLAKPLLTTTTLITPQTQTAPQTQINPTVGMRATAVTGMTLMMVANPDLQVMPGDIAFLPLSPKAGDALTINMTVRNIGTGAANNATVRAILQVDGAESTRREFPVNLAASGMTMLSWPVTTPSGKVLTAVVQAIVTNDSRADNNQAQASTSVAIALQRQLSPMILQVQPK
jgi:hypothetical protein